MVGSFDRFVNRTSFVFAFREKCLRQGGLIDAERVQDRGIPVGYDGGTGQVAVSRGRLMLTGRLIGWPLNEPSGTGVAAG